MAALSLKISTAEEAGMLSVLLGPLHQDPAQVLSSFFDTDVANSGTDRILIQ